MLMGFDEQGSVYLADMGGCCGGCCLHAIQHHALLHMQEHQEAQKLAEEEREAAAQLAAQAAANTAAAAAAAAAAGEPVTAPSSPTRNTHKVWLVTGPIQLPGLLLCAAECWHAQALSLCSFFTC